jgi:hypothetical protein
LLANALLKFVHKVVLKGQLKTSIDVHPNTSHSHHHIFTALEYFQLLVMGACLCPALLLIIINMEAKPAFRMLIWHPDMLFLHACT